MKTSSNGRKYTSDTKRRKRLAMVCEYTFPLVCRCPVDPKTVDSYTVKVTANRMIQVEELLEVAKTFEDRVVFQEDLTCQLSRAIRATVETTGRHSGVATRTVCGK